jgi:hypothetical protein
LPTISFVPHSKYFSQAFAIPSRSPLPSFLDLPRPELDSPLPNPGQPREGSSAGDVHGWRYASSANAGNREAGSREASLPARSGYRLPK